MVQILPGKTTELDGTVRRIPLQLQQTFESKRNVNRGAVAGSNTEEANERVDLLKEEIARLDAYEKTIDQHKQWCMQVTLMM